MSGQLSQLRGMTVVVADTGDLDSIKRFSPEDATTNPTLILKAVQSGKYNHFIDQAIEYGEALGNDPAAKVAASVDHLAASIGAEILKVVPGRISTEVDARLSFDAKGTIARARRLIHLYEKKGVGKDRVLIKIASTWEGIKAAEELEKEGINCNLTLLFGFAQAVAAAQAGVYLISPFVGRILDWYNANKPGDYALEKDPGVCSVVQIYKYYKKHGYKTVVMGASFRNLGEITELAGCDRLTIAPSLLEELENCTNPLPMKLSPNMDFTGVEDKLDLDQKAFRWMFNEDPMAVEKLADGIRRFAQDIETLEAHLLKLKGA